MRRRYLTAGVAVFAALATATFASPPDVRAAPPAPAATPSFKGTWFGATGQGREIDFTVNRRNRLTLLKLSFEIEGAGCSVEVEKTIRGTVASIRRKAFRVERETAQDAFTLTGRFTSKTAARGRLTGSFDGACAGEVRTTWTARKGKRPVDRRYDGTWEGPVTFPSGLDPAILAIVDPVIGFEIEDGKVTSVSAPWVIRGIGCEAALAGRILKALDPAVPLTANRLSVSFSSSAAGTKTWDVEGTFSTPTTASGSLVMAGPAGAFIGACTGSLDATWSATRG